MEVVVECLCGKKYAVDPAQVNQFACEGCKRELTVPGEALHGKLAGLRKRLAEGSKPEQRTAVREAAALFSVHALPILQRGAESGVREVVNEALVGLVSYDGPGVDLLMEWIVSGKLGVTRLVTAFKETEYGPGVDFLCGIIQGGKLRENQIAEAAAYLGESGSVTALETLKALRRKYPNLLGLIDSALARMRDIDESATAIPEEAKVIPGRERAAETPEKKGCAGLLFLLLVLALAGAAFLSGCDTVEKNTFGGLRGAVGYPPVSNCRVDIYDATRWANMDSSGGRIASATTNGAGRFSVDLGEAWLGRPLIVIARPSAAAGYLDYGAAGNPWIAFDGEPWVAVIRQFKGGEDVVQVSPLSTMAFHSLMRLPTNEAGNGGLRFDSRVVSSCNAAVATSFGISADPAEQRAAPPEGSPFASVDPGEDETGGESASYTYVCLQLALAANDFASQTTDGTDTALDFYEALFADARDGVLDGRDYGTTLPYLVSAGAPAGLVGQEGDGSSALLEWISGHALSGAQESAASGHAGGDFLPSAASILAHQSDSTGAVRITRVDTIDVANIPWSGSVEVTLRGEGFRHSDRFVIRSADNGTHNYYIQPTDTGADGEVLYRSASEWRLRLPDFAGSSKSIPSELQVPAGADYRNVLYVVQNRPEFDSTDRALSFQVGGGKLTARTDVLLLVHAEIGRLDASAGLDRVGFGNNIAGGATDPALLNPAVDDVYAVRLRVTNPHPTDTVTNVGIDLASSVFTQVGGGVVADTFDGASAGRAVIFGDSAGLPVEASLDPDETVVLTYPFVFLNTAIPADLNLGSPVDMDIVLSGNAGAITTADVDGFEVLVSLGPADPDATPELDPLSAAVLPAGVTAGESFEARLPVFVSPRSGTAMRDAAITDVSVTVAFDGGTVVFHVRDSYYRIAGQSGLEFFSAYRSSNGAEALPMTLTASADNDDLILTVRTSAGFGGSLDVSWSARCRDIATGAETTQTSAVNSLTVTP